jgi:hypothetical protein
MPCHLTAAASNTGSSKLVVVHLGTLDLSAREAAHRMVGKVIETLGSARCGLGS